MKRAVSRRLVRLCSLIFAGLLGVMSSPALAAHGTISITNARSRVVQVTIDKTYRGEVSAGKRRTFSAGLGRSVVEIRAPGGSLLTREVVDVRPGRVIALSASPSSGHVRVENRSGADLRLLIDGESRGSLLIGRSKELELRTGRHEIVATYRQHGAERTLQTSTMVLQRGELDSIVLRPADTTRVRIENETGRRAAVRIDGEARGTLEDGKSRLFEVTPGPHRLALMVGERELDGTTLDARRYADNAFIAEVRLGELVVVNPLPIPVEVTVNGGRERRVAAMGRASFRRLEPGRVTVTITRETGESLLSAEARIRAGDDTSVTVPEPRRGVALVMNDVPRTARVLIDGVVAAKVPGLGEHRMELSLGAHPVIAIDDDGRLLMAGELDVGRYDTAIFVVGSAQARLDLGPVTCAIH